MWGGREEGDVGEALGAAAGFMAAVPVSGVWGAVWGAGSSAVLNGIGNLTPTLRFPHKHRIDHTRPLLVSYHRNISEITTRQ